MRRESLKLQETDWQRLEQLAAATRSLYSGKPSWRRMILRLARGEVIIRATKRRTRSRLQRRPSASRPSVVSLL